MSMHQTKMPPALTNKAKMAILHIFCCSEILSRLGARITQSLRSDVLASNQATCNRNQLARHSRLVQRRNFYSRARVKKTMASAEEAASASARANFGCRPSPCS